MSDGNAQDPKRLSPIVEARSATTTPNGSMMETTQEELARQGEALEASDKNDGIWRTMGRYKMALVYSMQPILCTRILFRKKDGDAYTVISAGGLFMCRGLCESIIMSGSSTTESNPTNNNPFQGYDSIANTATLAMPSFQIYFGHFNEHINAYYLESIWTSLWSSMTGVGQIIGSAVAGPLSQKIGRRYTAMASGAVTV